MSYEIKENQLFYKGNNCNELNEKAEMKQFNEYAAIYDLTGKGNVHNRDAKPIYCDFYKEGQYIFSLKRNGYRPPVEMFLEFFKNGDKTVFMFNLHHGVITIHNANTGEIIGCDKENDKFLMNWGFSNDKKYMYLEGWWWNPIGFQAIYKIKDLLNIKEYDPEIIDSYDYDNKEQFDFNKENNKIIVKKDKSEYEIEEFMKLYNDNNDKIHSIELM
jgi:hypothetical protein